MPEQSDEGGDDDDDDDDDGGNDLERDAEGDDPHSLAMLINANPDATLSAELREYLVACLSVVRVAKEEGQDAMESLKQHSPLINALDGSGGAQAIGLAVRALRLESLHDAAIRLYSDLQINVDPDAYLYTEVMYTYEAMERWHLVLHTFQQMKKNKIQPNLLCYNSALRANAKMKSWHHAVRILKEMKDSGITPTVQSMQTAMAAVPSKTHWEVTLNMFKSMKNFDLPPDAECYKRAIRACAVGSLSQQCVDLFQEMRSKGLEVDEDTVWWALRATAHSENVDQISSVFREIEADASLRLSEVHYDVLISACERSGNWLEVLTLAAGMGNRGVSPHEITCNTVLLACVELGKWEVALNLFRTMRGDGAKLDMVAYATLINALSDVAQYNELLKLYEELQSDPNIVGTVDSSSVPSVAEHDAIPQIGGELAIPVIDALAEVGRRDDAIALYRGVADRGSLRLWRQRRFGPSSMLLDARRIPAQVAAIAVQSALQDAAKVLADIAADDAAAKGNALSMARSGFSRRTQDILVAVEAGEVQVSAGRLEAPEPSSAAALVLGVARGALGEEAKLEYSDQPVPCIRIPWAELESLLVQRVQRAVSEFTPTGAGM